MVNIYGDAVMKKILMAVLAAVMTVSMAACGSNDGDGMGNNAAVTSTNGSIELSAVDGFTATADEYCEKISVAPEGSEDYSRNVIDVQAPEDNGVYENFQFLVYGESPYQYREGEAYTSDMLRSDIDTYIAEYPNIYSNPTKVTMGAYDYIRCDCVTNAEESYYYFTIVNDRPCTVRVIGGDLLDIDSDEVELMIAGIVFNVK